MSGAGSGTVTLEELSKEVENKQDSETDNIKTEPVEPLAPDNSIGDSISELERRIAAEKELQAVKSNLGRKLSSLEAKLEALASVSSTDASNTSSDVDDDFDIPTTREEFMAAFEDAKRKDAAKEMESQKEYEQTYLSAVNNMNQDNPVLHQEIYDEMMKNYNVKVSSNPVLDAELNYAKAEAALLKKKMGTKINPLRGNKSTGYTGQVDPQPMVNKQKSESYTLSAEEKEFARSMGMTNEQIQKALDSPLKPGQSRY